MYSEKQHFQHRYLGWLQWGFAAIAIVQLAVFTAVELGWLWLPFAPAIHIGILALAAGIWLTLANSHLSLRVSTRGWDVRYFPFQLYHRHIDWQEIKNVVLIPHNEVPANAPFGLPMHDFTNTYLLTNERCKVLRIDLVTGGKVFVSTSNASELIHFFAEKCVFGSVGIRTGCFSCRPQRLGS